MKFIRFWANTDYCGTDSEEYAAFEDFVTEAELDEMSEEFTVSIAETYEYLAMDWGDEFEEEEDENEREERRDDYYNSCSGGWEYVTKEEYLENKG